MSDYSWLDRTLHTLALNFQSVKIMSFDIERKLAKMNTIDIAKQPHVFVTGLARAGTSILLRILHQTGNFASQTYRDMPFVLSPQVWRRLNSSWRRDIASKERAHADGVMVDFDSVEAFEEVFWLTFAGELYIRDDHLRAHSIDKELATLFKDFIAVVISAYGCEGPIRYLSKNNNNILRLQGLARALPAAHIIVSFRSPLQQAHSLLRQHQNFSNLQNVDPFIQKYMRWLGHFEFGRDYRPFTFGDDISRATMKNTDQIHHWLERWTKVYRGVLATLPENAILWDYDAFCADPVHMITALAEKLNLDVDLLRVAVHEIRPMPSRSAKDTLQPADLAEAQETHSELRHRAMRRFV